MYPWESEMNLKKLSDGRSCDELIALKMRMSKF